MWIAFRLILAIIGFVIRQLSRGKKKATDGVYDGIGYFRKLNKSKSGIRSFAIGMERRSPTWLRFHAESVIDRVFKKLGVANEVQTGDPRFDDLVYVTCDHPYIRALLVESPQLRDAIVQAFEAGYRRVVFNGSTVAIERKSDREPIPRDFKLLKQIYTASARLEDELPSRFGDPFLWKALVAEGLIWSLAGYAIGAILQMSLIKEDFHVSRTDVIKTGLMAAGGAFVVLLGLIILTMRGSSRGHRVVVESALVLLLALPAASIQLTGDTNRALDNAAPMVVSRTYTHCEMREHRGKRGRSRWFSYHLWIEPEAETTTSIKLRPSIEISRELCDASTPGGTVALTIGSGRWGLPWYRKIQIGDVVWSSPL